jgi:hypothetical protein
VRNRLRALWTLHAIGAASLTTIPTRATEHHPKQLLALGARNIATRPLLAELLEHSDENLRWWSVMLLCESRNPSPQALQKFAAMAREDTSAFVRLALASALQRIPAESRWPIARELVLHDADAGDASLPLMIWYGIESAVPQNRAEAVKLASSSKIPLVRELIVRRLAER